MIAILLANGFEEIEALTPLDMLRRAGLDVKTVSITDEKSVKGSHGIEVIADLTRGEVDVKKIDYVIFPGGLPGAENLDKSDFTDEVIEAVKESNGGFAAICAAPMVLGHRGLLVGKKATCYPGFEKELNGAVISDEKAITDGNVTTAIGMGASHEFALEIIKALCGKKASDELANATLPRPDDRVYSYLRDIDFVNAVMLAIEKKKISTSLIQRKCCIAYGKSAKYLDVMEILGIVSAQCGQKPRNVLVTLEEFRELLENNGVNIEDLKPSNRNPEEPARAYLYNFEDELSAESFSAKKNVDYSDYKAPSTELLRGTDSNNVSYDDEITENGEKIISVLSDFGVNAVLKNVEVGPRFVRYEIVPAKNVKINTVINLFDDIALSVAADGMRMEAPIPGKSAVGIEIPRKNPENVFIRELIESEDFKNNNSSTAVCIGKDISGNTVLADIAKMPHAIIAGAVGMGKSMQLNSMITSILYHARPDEVKFILIDPTGVEFRAYAGIPHLLVPVITDVKVAAGALVWLNDEMERRYDAFEKLSVRNIAAYNEKAKENTSIGKPLPKIIVIIDELNDLMLQARKPVEDLVMIIAQKARAAGIHLIIGTQRPSADVITGVIKANIPTRIAFKLASFVDSKSVLEQAGAEKLLNNGDMLFWPVGVPKPTRVQGAFVSYDEVTAITNFLKNQGFGYDEEVLDEIKRETVKCAKLSAEYEEDDEDSVYELLNDKKFTDCVEQAIENGKISTAFIQRKINVGYGKAAKFIDAMEEMGLISAPCGQKPREVLITLDEWNKMLESFGDAETCETIEDFTNEKQSEEISLLLEQLGFNDESKWELFEEGEVEEEELEEDDDGKSFFDDKDFLEAVEIAVKNGKVSTSLLQRKCGIGFSKASEYINAMEDIGLVSEENGAKPRDVLMTLDEWREFLLRRGLK